MADHAVKDAGGSIAAAWLMRGRSEAGARSSEKIVSFTAPPADTTREGGEGRRNPGVQRDWSSALDLIQEASEAIRISEERAADLETQMQQVAAQAAEEIRLLEVQIATGAQRLQASEERVRAAEARANEAEAWLVRLHDAILNGFRREPRPNADQAGAGETGLPARQDAGFQ